MILLGGSHQEVKHWCSICDVCWQERSRAPRVLRAPMAQYNVGAPMERIAHHEWDEHVPLLLMAYRHVLGVRKTHTISGMSMYLDYSWHTDTTGITPAKVMMGRDH